MANYSFYLFSKLFDLHIGHNYEYDLMYQDISNLYFIYQRSKYNNFGWPEYECMSAFFIDNMEYIKTQQYLIDIDNL
jgi:hypothetical protein